MNINFGKLQRDASQAEHDNELLDKCIAIASQYGEIGDRIRGEIMTLKVFYPKKFTIGDPPVEVVFTKQEN